MAEIRIVYVPWSKAEAGELNKDSEEFKDAMSERTVPKGREWRVAFSDESGKLTGLASDSQIYVLGHSDVGKEWITNRINNLEYDKVCERLKDSGLSEHYAGKLKFYNCMSALDAKGAKGENCFASMAAQYLRKKEYKNARIFGYAGYLCQPIAYRRKMYVAYGATKAEFGASAVRVEYDEQGLPKMTQPVSTGGEEFSPWDD